MRSRAPARKLAPDRQFPMLASLRMKFSAGSRYTPRSTRPPIGSQGKLAVEVRGEAPSSGHPHRERTQKIALEDVDAAIAKDRVGDCDVEIEVPQHERVNVNVAFHVALV